MNRQRSSRGGLSQAGLYCAATALGLALMTWAASIWQGGQQPARADNPPLAVSTFIDNLAVPWDMVFTPDETMLVNQRGGGFKARHSDGTVTDVTADFSDLKAAGEGGLMGMVIDPGFATNRRLYTCQGHKSPLEIQVISWTINGDYSQATRVDDPLVGGIPMKSNGRHSGCRLRFGSDGYLYISTGDAATNTIPQDLTSLGGKVLRVDAQTGQGAADNPYINSESANSKLIYSYGHRNPQGLALRPGSSQMWVVEHGPQIDDEINLLQKGGNYGWDPVSPTPGDNSYYEWGSMTDTSKFPAAIAAKWSSGNSTYATAGGIFLEGDHWGDKEGRLAVATLKNSTLYLFDFDSDGDYQSVSIPTELKRTYHRLRSVVIGPDDALYIAASDRILRVAPVPDEQEEEPTADDQMPTRNPPADTTPPPIVIDQTETQLVASTNANDADQSSWRNQQVSNSQCDQGSFDNQFDQSRTVNLDQLAPGSYTYCFAVKDTSNNWAYKIFEFQIAPPVVETPKTNDDDTNRPGPANGPNGIEPTDKEEVDDPASSPGPPASTSNPDNVKPAAGTEAEPSNANPTSQNQAPAEIPESRDSSLNLPASMVPAGDPPEETQDAAGELDPDDKDEVSPAIKPTTNGADNPVKDDPNPSPTDDDQSSGDGGGGQKLAGWLATIISAGIMLVGGLWVLFIKINKQKSGGD